MKRIFIPIIIVCAILIFVVSVLLLVIIRDQNGNKTAERMVPSFTDEQKYAAPFTVDYARNNQGNTVGQQSNVEYKAVVSLKNPLQSVPNAFQIKASYNKDKVDIKKVEVGNLWTDANVLMNTNDPTVGIIKFAAGQGFSATKNTQGKSIMVIHYSIPEGAPEDIDLVMYPESKFGYADQSALRPIDSSSVIIHFE